MISSLPTLTRKPKTPMLASDPNRKKRSLGAILFPEDESIETQELAGSVAKLLVPALKSDDELRTVSKKQKMRKWMAYLTRKLRNCQLFFRTTNIIPSTKKWSNTCLSVLHLNIRSIRKHINDLEALVYSLESQPDILCLTETWLGAGDDENCFRVPGYNQSLTKHRGGKRGGVMLQVKSNCSILNDITVTYDEAICADIEKSSFKLGTLAVYNEPRTDKMEFLDLLDHNLEQLSQPFLFFVVCGDSNKNVLESNLLVNRYKTCIESIGFEFFDLAPTRITSSTSSCIDYIIIQNIVNPNSEVLSFQSFSYHFPVVLTWSFKTKSSHNPTVFRDYSF